MTTRLAESPGRPLERHGNVSPREMTVHGAHAPGQNPAYRPAHSPLVEEIAVSSRLTRAVWAGGIRRASQRVAVYRTSRWRGRARSASSDHEPTGSTAPTSHSPAAPSYPILMRSPLMPHRSVSPGA